MGQAPNPKHITYHKTSSPGAGQYEVRYEDVAVGRVGRFQMGAGQFGSRWIATSLQGKRSGHFSTRDAAALWLVTQPRDSDPS